MDIATTRVNDSNNILNSEKGPAESQHCQQAPTKRRFPFLQSLRPKNRLQSSFTTRDNSKKHVPNDSDELDTNYRIMPLAIGCIIPASILINVPSLTSAWVGLSAYDAVADTWGPVQEIPIPHWMDGMVIAALVMAIICNLCVLSRFLERHIYHSVILSLITASLQDVLCIGAIIPFCLMYRPSDGYVYLEGFWSMVASLSFSATATVLISIDLHRTPQFRLQGSGVTHKQRMLIAQAMAFCFYLAIGALIFIWIEDWTFLEALFFVMITITTIGFGDIVPKTTGGRVFVVFYASGGIVLFAMAVNAIRYVILEDLHRQFAIRAQERKAKKKARKVAQKEERIREQEKQKRIQEALENVQMMEMQQQGQMGVGMGSHHLSILRHFTVPHGITIRSPALFHRQGSGPSPKDQRTPSISFEPAKDSSPGYDTMSEVEPVGNSQSGGQSSNEGPVRLSSPDEMKAGSKDELADEMGTDTLRHNSAGTIDTIPVDKYHRHHHHHHHHDQPGGLRELIARWYCVFGRACGFKGAANCASIAAPMANLKKQREADKELAYKESMQEYSRRLRFSFAIFMCFWLVGAAIYQTLEPWSYGQAMYFSFIAFSSIGYGDLVPLSLAGRAIFLAYCLIGVVTLTSLASLISEVLSRSLRRHVVQAQLRRSERFAEQGQTAHRRASDIDLERGDAFAEVLTNNGAIEDGMQEERMRTLQTLASAVAAGHSENPVACQGSLRNLVQVSRDFDTLLQKVLGLDYALPDGVGSGTKDDVRTIAITAAPESKTKAQVPLVPEKILDYLEKEEEELSDSAYFSPSMSRDITSTSSIHRNSIAIQGRNFMDLKSNGTYHGAGPSSSSISSSSESKLNITSWPKGPLVTSTKKQSDNERLHPLQKQSSLSSHNSLQAKPTPTATTATISTVTTHRHNQDGSVTISATHWRNLVDYSKQFRILTDSCDEALQRLLAWEAAERKMRMRRQRAKERQGRLLQARRRRLFELGGTYGVIDDDIEDDELEELDFWYDQENDVDEDDGYQEDDDGDDDTDELDQNRERIARTLLGTIGAEGDPQTGHGRGRVRHEGVPSHQRHRSRTRSRSRQRVNAQSADALNDAGAGTGTSDDIYRMGKPSSDDSSNTDASALLMLNDLEMHRRRDFKERRWSTSRSRDVRFSNTPDGTNENRHGSGVVASRRPPLHTIHTNEVPPSMSSEGEKNQTIGSAYRARSDPSAN